MPILASILSNLIQEHFFRCNPNLRYLVYSFIGLLEKLALLNKAQMKMKFLENQTAIKSRFARNLETLSQRRSHCVGNEAEDDSSKNISTQLLQMQKNQQFDLQEQIKGYCNTLAGFGFNSARHDVKLLR